MPRISDVVPLKPEVELGALENLGIIVGQCFVSCIKGSWEFGRSVIEIDWLRDQRVGEKPEVGEAISGF